MKQGEPVLMLAHATSSSCYNMISIHDDAAREGTVMTTELLSPTTTTKLHNVMSTPYSQGEPLESWEPMILGVFHTVPQGPWRP